MKQALSISGRVELSRQEIALAVKDWLVKNYNFIATKFVFVAEDKTLQKAVIEVKKEPTDDVEEFKPLHQVKERDQTNGFVRPNIGIFAYLKDYFEEARKNKTKVIAFDDLFRDVKKDYPKFDERRLRMYLYDRRQLPNIKFKDKVITV